MIVTYYGKQFFKIQLGDTVIAYNPIGKDSKNKTSRFGADIVLSSLRHVDFSGADQCAYGEKVPTLIAGPGEYEVDGIFIKGFGTETTYEGEKKWNTVYSVVFEGINLCFLGSLAKVDTLSREVKEGLGEIDVLFAPIGGRASIDTARHDSAESEMLAPADAYKLTIALDAKVVIPMDYEDGKGSLETFIKEGGANAEKMEKFTFKKKDLEGKEGSVVVVTAA